MSRELDWLHARGLTDKTIKEAGLTWADGKIKFPWRVDGKEVGYQIRWIDEKQFKFNEGFDPKTVYYPSGKLIPGYGIWVTEGAMDALILQQLGFPAVAVASATSLGGVASLPGRDLFLALDNDDPGNTACEHIAAVDTTHKLFRVIFDGKDPNECFLKNKGTFPCETVPFLAGGIKHIKEIHLNGNVSHASIINFDNGLPSWNAGDLIVLYGKEKSGKSSWALQTIAQNKEVPFLLEEYEMLPERVKEWFLKLGGSDEQPFYVTTQFKEFQFHNLLARINSAVKQLGVRLIVIDHIHFLASGKDNIVNLLANITQKLKLLAMELRIAIVIIAHETGEEIRDCRLIGGNSDHILHLKRMKNAISIEGKHRYAPAGTYTFATTLK